LLASALLSLFVDPYRAFRVPGRLDDAFPRPRASQQVGLVKSLGVAHARPRTLVLGNSRAEIGFDPESPSWPAALRPVYSAAIPGSALKSDVRTLASALQAGEVRHLVIGLEFLDFLTEPDEPEDVRDEMRDAGARGSTLRAVQTLFSLDSTIDSLATLS